MEHEQELIILKNQEVMIRTLGVLASGTLTETQFRTLKSRLSVTKKRIKELEDLDAHVEAISRGA